MADRLRSRRDLHWRTLDGLSMEHCSVSDLGELYLLRGCVILSTQGIPTTLNYSVNANRKWRTTSTQISIENPQGLVSFVLTLDARGVWSRTPLVSARALDEPVDQVAGCVDIDLAFSPVTNTLPIRRLGLAIGAKSKVTAAWVKFPSMSVEPLEQEYERVSEFTYRYRSFPHNFEAMLEVDELGIVRTYEGLWETVAVSDWTKSGT